MRTLLVLSVALFLVVASLQADAKRVSIPEAPIGDKLKGSATISGRRLLQNDNDNEKNKANGKSTYSPTGDQTHRVVINAHT